MWTANGWRAVRGGGLGNWGDEISVNGVDRGKTSVHIFSNLFLKMLTDGAIMTEAGGLFQYFTTLAEKAGALFRRWLVPWSTL